MDFQQFVDLVGMPCCVMSVQKTPEGTCGEIRILVSNRAYKEVMGPAYYDGMLYSELVPQDNKFEDYCFRAAILKQRMHAYVETVAFHCWTDQTMIPLASDREDLGYCQFIFEFTQQAESERMSSLSINAASMVINACIKLMGSEDFKTSVGDVLEVIMDASGAQGSRVMLADHENREAVIFAERVSGDAWVARNLGDNVISYDLMRSWEEMIGVSNAVIVKDEQDMAALARENPAWARSMRENHVSSLVLIPLRRERRVIGYLYVLNFDVAKVVEVKELVELMSFFLGSEISNHLLLEKLDRLSQIDALTGLYNRRAMIQRMQSLAERRRKPAYGVINIDLNGLKVVNDGKGHDAGDRFLIQAAELLRKVFHHDDLFRTGGDEFIVITTDIDRDTFERKLRLLRGDAEKNGVSLAAGAFWSDGSDELATAMRRADKRMYADKQAFYEKIGSPSLRERRTQEPSPLPGDSETK